MIDTDQIDPYVVRVLWEHRWSADRKFDIADWTAMLQNEGYVIFDNAREILETLGGLSVRDNGNHSHMGAEFDFDALSAGSGEFDRMEWYETLAGEHLYPIGNMVQAFVYVGESRRIYFGSMDTLYEAGDCVEDYLNGLFDPRPGRRAKKWNTEEQTT